MPPTKSSGSMVVYSPVFVNRPRFAKEVELCPLLRRLGQPRICLKYQVSQAFCQQLCLLRILQQTHQIIRRASISFLLAPLVAATRANLPVTLVSSRDSLS